MNAPLSRNPRTGIRTRIALSIGLVTIAASVILSLVAGYFARHQIEHDQGSALLATAGNLMETLDRAMYERYREIQIVSAMSDIRDPTVSREAKRALIERIQGTHGHHGWIGIAAPDGTAVVGTQGYLEGRDVSKRPWFKGGMAGPYVGDVHDALLLAKLLPNPTGDPVYLLDVAAPILGPDDQPIGVICSHLHWRWIDAALKSLPPDRAIEVYLLSKDNLILHGPAKKMRDRFEGESPAVMQAMRTRSEGHYLASWRGGEDYLTAHVASKGMENYPGLGWHLILRQKTDVAFATAIALQQRIMLFGLLLGATFAWVGWLVAGRLTRPIEAITAEAEAIAGGDLARKLPVYGGKDEISRLSSGLARMLDAMRKEISGREAAEAQVRLAATVFDASVEGIVITDADNLIVAINPAFSKITGFSAEDVLGQNPRMLGSGRLPPSFYESMWNDIARAGRWQGEIWNRRKNGEVFPEWLVITRVTDNAGETKNYVAVFSDITERKEAEARIRFLADHDALTDLPNRHLFNDHLSQALARAPRLGSRMAVILVDLDRFKDVNDTLGHQAGDAVLRGVADRLQACLRPGDTIARAGGDEFAILMEDIPDGNAVAPVLEGILKAFATPLGEHGIAITPSIGIAIYPEDGGDIDTLAKHAEIAMYQAKESGRNNYQFFLPSLNERIVARLESEIRLRRAVEQGLLELYYQPQVDVATGRIVGAEALARWHDDVRGMIPPAEFIPLAEETGLIGPLGDWVLRSASRAAMEWASQGMPVRVAVNISAKQLAMGDLAGHIGQILAENRLKPSLLEVELTESVVMAASDSERVNLEQLRRLGLEISLDDFGTGYSSLSYLRQLPVSSLKIDRSFIADLDSPEGAKLTAIIIMLAQSLDLKIVAEGIETAAQLEFIRERGVEAYQGYYFSKPLPKDRFETLLRENLADW